MSERPERMKEIAQWTEKVEHDFMARRRLPISENYF